MVAEKNTITGLEVADPTLRTDNEKSAALYASDVSSSGAGEYDDLPDPDAGKSDEERAKLVSLPLSSLLCLRLTDINQDKALVWKMDKWLIPWLSLLYLLS